MDHFCPRHRYDERNHHNFRPASGGMSFKDSLDVLYLMFQWKTTFELPILVNGATVMNNERHT